MKIPWLIALFLLAACASPQVDRQWWDREKGNFVADWPVPSLGLYADVQQRVEVVLVGGAADVAGIQVGDVLLELRPAASAAVTLTDPVPYTDDKAVWALMRAATELQKTSTWYSIRVELQPVSGPFIVKVQRESQTLEFEILLKGQPAWTADSPTPTPVTRTLRYF